MIKFLEIVLFMNRLDSYLKTWKALRLTSKIGVIFLVLLFFFNANITAINRGPCVVSACGWESERFADAMVDRNSEPSTYLHTASNPLFAPTTLLIYLLPYPKETQFVPYSLNFLTIGFDNNETETLDRSVDFNWAKTIYIVTKLFVFLSFPLWFLVALWSIQTKRRFVFVVSLLLVISYFTLDQLYWISTTGVSTFTWKLLLTGSL